jgi:hypothetical protein
MFILKIAVLTRGRAAKLALAAATLCYSVSNSFAADEWPEIPVAPKAKVEWVASNLTYSGLPMRIQRFESKVSAQEVVSYYRGHWGRGDVKPVENTVNGWQIIAMPHGPYFVTVQVKDVGGGQSQGLIGVTATHQIADIPKIDTFPKLGATYVHSVVESKDPGRSNKQVILSNGHSVSANARFYESQLTFSGWRRIQVSGEDRKSFSEPAYFAIYRKGKEQIDIAIARQSDGVQTTVVANLSRYE